MLIFLKEAKVYFDIKKYTLVIWFNNIVKLNRLGFVYITLEKQKVSVL